MIGYVLQFLFLVNCGTTFQLLCILGVDYKINALLYIQSSLLMATQGVPYFFDMADHKGRNAANL